MRIGVASGKGGTGKTLVAANLSAAVGTDLADLDVEEPNAAIYFGGEVTSILPVGRPVPSVDAARCDLCGECARGCEFNALVRLPDRIQVLEELCHGCGACLQLCPRRAIAEVGHEAGEIIRMRSGARQLTYGRLKVGEPMAVPLVRAVKELLPIDRSIILDCPPGTSCTMVEAVRGSDYVIMVTEPTPFGMHDLMMAAEVLDKMHLPHGAVVNKDGPGGVDVAGMCAGMGIEVLSRIPFRRDIAERHADGQLLDRPEDRMMFRELWEAVMREVRK